MNTKLSRFFSCACVTVLMFGASIFSAPDAVAGDNHRRDFRRHDGQVIRSAAVEHDIRRHERDRRAFIAGAAAQQHRDDYYRDGDRYRYRDGYRDRYRDRYYDRDDDDNDGKIGAALVGAAVGAVVTGVVMSNSNSNNSSSNYSK